MHTSKKISVVICTFNGEKYITEQLDSILSQTYPIYEIIIQDDGSTDNTCHIIDHYCEKYPLIKLFKNKKNVGVNENFRTAFLRVTGDYVAPSDQDDIWLPHKIETMLNLIGKKMLCFSRSQVLYSDGTKGKFMLPFPLTYEQCILNGCLAGHTCLFHNSMLPYFKYKLLTANNFPFDYVISIVGFTLNSFVSTTEELQIWRRHPEALTKWVAKNEQFETLNTNAKRESKFGIFVFTVRNLLVGKRLSILKKHYETMWFLQKKLNGEKHVIKLCFFLSNQSFLHYFLAGIIIVRHRHKFFPTVKTTTLHQKLSLVSYSFRFPFKVWQEWSQYEQQT